ncbi:uncharacterized protein O3C94_019215 [Discoglossus pictus]
MEEPQITGNSVCLSFQKLVSWLLLLVLSLFFPFSVLGLLIVFGIVKLCSKTGGGSQVVVGIFSRSSQSDYFWLTNQLRSKTFGHLVKEVRPFYIANDAAQKFSHEVAQCNFGILYHTKNRGRINITNVTDSLYDWELKHLSDILGKQNVIVLIDDLETNGHEDRTRIFTQQPDIQTNAQELFLFSKNEKKQITQSGKLDQIEDIMVSAGWGASTNPLQALNFFPYLFSMARWFKNSIIYMCTDHHITNLFRSRRYRSDNLDEPLLV